MQQQTEHRKDPDILTIAYIAAGFTRFCVGYHAETGGHPNFDGHLEAMSQVIQHALLADSVADYFDKTGGHATVWVYEVAEPFGEELSRRLHEGTLGELNGQCTPLQVLRSIMVNAGYDPNEVDQALSQSAQIH
jgi:hypothetical protein